MSLIRSFVALIVFLLAIYVYGVPPISFVYPILLVLSFFLGFFMHKNGVLQTLKVLMTTGFYLLILLYWIIWPYVLAVVRGIITEKPNDFPEFFKRVNIILACVSMLYVASFFVVFGPKIWRAIKILLHN